MVKVIIFHNVARECRYCGLPVIGKDGKVLAPSQAAPGYCTKSPSNRLPAHHSPGLANLDGYKPGHPLVRVFELDHPDADPEWIAGRMFEAFNAPEEMLKGVQLNRASQYRARRLRSLSVGDVVQVGDVMLACASVGWIRLLNEVTGDQLKIQDLYGSTPWTGA